MRDFQNLVDDVKQDPSVYGANNFARGLGLFAGFMTMASKVAVYGTTDLWTSGLYSAAIGISAYGASFTIAYTFLHIAPALIPILAPSEAHQGTKKVGKTKQSIATSPIVQPVINQLPEKEPSWKDNLQKYLTGNTLRVRNKSRILGDEFNPSWIAWIAESKWKGELSHVSERRLHEDAGIDRFPEATLPESGLTPAKLVISMLQDMELIAPTRQWYVWTEQGERVFPTSPTFEEND